MSTVGHFANIFHLFSILILFKNGQCVPIDYCLQPLNTSDCNMPPTPVFSYYKPGSRCEIQFWRGCPTWNNFPDEYSCSHYCIGRFQGDNDTQDHIVVENKTELELPKDRCKGELNKTECTQRRFYVYTYQNGSCEGTDWWGCESPNLFFDDKTCIEACVKDENELDNWKTQLHLMQPGEVKDIDNLIDNVMEEDNTTEAPETTTQPETTEATAPAGATESSTEPVSTTVEVTSEAPTTTTTEPQPPGDAEEVITT